MKLEISDEDKLDSWETLIDAVEKSDIPMEFVSRITLVFKTGNVHGDEQDINVNELRDHGWTDDHIQEIVEETFNEHHNNIKTVNFFLNVEHVASTVQEQTDILLEGTK